MAHWAVCAELSRSIARAPLKVDQFRVGLGGGCADDKAEPELINAATRSSLGYWVQPVGTPLVFDRTVFTTVSENSLAHWAVCS